MRVFKGGNGYAPANADIGNTHDAEELRVPIHVLSTFLNYLSVNVTPNSVIFV